MKHEGYREQRRLSGVQMTEVEVHMATYSLFATDHALTAGYPQARRRASQAQYGAQQTTQTLKVWLRQHYSKRHCSLLREL